MIQILRFTDMNLFQAQLIYNNYKESRPSGILYDPDPMLFEIQTHPTPKEVLIILPANNTGNITTQIHPVHAFNSPGIVKRSEQRQRIEEGNILTKCPADIKYATK